MKANELRINNYLEYFMEDFENPWRLTQVDIDDMAYFVQYPNDTDYRPIPLTEEWLLKFGFVKRTPTGYYFDMGRMSINLPDFEYKNIRIDVKLKYVHQLQNLYFALTGEELTLKQKIMIPQEKIEQAAKEYAKSMKSDLKTQAMVRTDFTAGVRFAEEEMKQQAQYFAE